MYLWAESTKKLERWVLQHGGGSSHCGRFETGGEEHERFGDRARQLHGLRHTVDDIDLAALGLRVAERHDRAWDLDHVAVGRDAHALTRERDAFVHFRHVGNADRAPRPHDDVQRAGQRSSESEPGDRLLVTSAHVHD